MTRPIFDFVGICSRGRAVGAQESAGREGATRKMVAGGKPTARLCEAGGGKGEKRGGAERGALGAWRCGRRRAGEGRRRGTSSVAPSPAAPSWQPGGRFPWPQRHPPAMRAIPWRAPWRRLRAPARSPRAPPPPSLPLVVRGPSPPVKPRPRPPARLARNTRNAWSVSDRDPPARALWIWMAGALNRLLPRLLCPPFHRTQTAASSDSKLVDFWSVFTAVTSRR